ncbi:TPA_exp: Uncharacterized protein A8136_6505 [Trichophyton benhamiae CBS 112371]|uniref:Exocyst complex component SEC5 n=1 Tax=Arthroderma benhamiae (strain ATCC MYA-4681 / CBS 112371) TaxID=663331 RepID=D4ARF4_ARTBC|nr:uncharacterized protein ARB_06696 [Trichophyton benhamiae CBS 112371]EFE34297.1 hypothetical protein ARB_06696 [Trichophyton benhamiae CBS 112371]DAA77245.1 TPA_exp: Uncharacterized protein A8136_6505 [Trichophyton benhamiae CBS 112371]
MADVQPRDAAQFYNLPDLYPEEWPAQLDSDSDGEGEGPSKSDDYRRRSQIRYSGLIAGKRDQERFKGGDGTALKDEPDPLGGPDTILRTLRMRGLPVDDERVRKQFLLSSKNFSASDFLSETQESASTQSLLQGLDYLSRSIDEKSASLKMLVESNFERFVRVKATLDNVYTEMKNSGESNSRLHRSPSGEHRRSGSQLGGSATTGLWRSKSKPALRPDTPSSGSLTNVSGISTPLAEASEQARELWSEALNGQQREEGLKSILDAVEKQREMYEIGGHLSKSIQERDYQTIFDQYNSARRFANEAKAVAERAASTKQPLRDEQVYTILVTGRMWMDVEKQIQAFKRDLWKRLSNAQSTSPVGAGGVQAEEHMELIAALLELGVEDNPVWVWLLSRYDYLKNKITAFCQRSRFEIETLRRRLAAGKKPDPQLVAPYLRNSLSEGSRPSRHHLDSESVIELWECIHTFLKKLLSVQGGILGDVLGFWDSTQSFLDGSKQRLLPAGFDGESRKHHRLSTNGVNDLKDGIIELMGLIRDNVVTIFAEPPEDLASLIPSALPTSPTVPFTGLTPESRLMVDPQNIPPLPEKTGQPWDDFAFWPPYSNSLSGVHYLGEFLILIGTAASEMASLSPISGHSGSYDRLKLLVSGTRERCARAACAAWNSDAELCKYLEDWTRHQTIKSLSKMPSYFMTFESSILSGMQKILYISESMRKPGAVEVITPPPAKLLQLVRTQFVTSVYKALSGLVENAEHPVNADVDVEWVLPSPEGAATGPDTHSSVFASGGVDSNNRNVRILLTLSNLKSLRAEHVPQLITTFESSFAVKLTDESKTIQDVLGQIDTRLFQSYLKPIVETLKHTILEGIASPDWVPANSRPDQIRPYVYSTMLSLVMVHNEVSTTLPMRVPTPQSSSSSNLTNKILAELLTQVSSALLEAFMRRSQYTLPALMQATLDTEFIAQTLSQYSTDAASKVQGQIYLELDRRTTNDARAKLQAELGEMRGVLKRLREATRGEFACFRKPKTPSSSK